MSYTDCRQRGRGDQNGYGAIKEKVSLCMFQDLFFYSQFLQFLLKLWNLGLPAVSTSVIQSHSRLLYREITQAGQLQDA